jgi:hypothetical protein
MGLIKNFLPKLKNEKKPNPYFTYFLEGRERSDHPYNLALGSYAQLRESAQVQDEIFLYMVEDILASSLYATFYEELLNTIAQNPQYTSQLIEAFSKDETNREQIIATQSQHHFNYLLNDGHCDGCTVCDHHADVAEVLPQLKSANLPFFRNLYLGMQTIQFAMEELTFDMLRENPDWTAGVRQEEIGELRKNIFSYVEKLEL